MTRSLRSRAAAASLAVALAGLLAPSPVRALKIDTHVWVAQQVLNDLWPDCALQIDPFGSFAVDPGLCAMLKANPSVYRMGALGPDAFPDVVGGQMTTHPGTDEWKTDDWLAHLLREAGQAPVEQRPAAYAFALGYLTHAAADVFSHTYVNTYSGDFFFFTDGETEVELRHMALEDFVRAHTPALRDEQGVAFQTWDRLELPATFVRDAVLRDPDAAREYWKSPATYHLAGMYAYWSKVNAVIAKAEEVQGQVAARINGVNDTIGDLEDSLGWGCFIDPASCLATFLAIEAAQAALGTLNAVNDAIVTSTLAPLYLLRNEVETAMTEYVKTSRQVSIEIMKPDGDPLYPLTLWACNYAGVFAAVPTELVRPGCTVYSRVNDAMNGLSQFHDKVDDLLGPFAWADPAYAIDQLVNELKEEFKELAFDVVDSVTGDSVLTSIARMRLVRHTDATLDAEFEGDGSGKGLLLIPDVARRVKAEMHLDAAGKFDPSQYAMIKDAIVLAKLVLLGPGELSRMVHEAGIPETAYGEALYTPAEPFNVLLRAIKSIDGNQQWQENALPYPRLVADTAARSFGRPFSDGFRFWQDCRVRPDVFEKIFSGPIAPGVEAASTVGLDPIDKWDPPPGPAFPLGVDQHGNPSATIDLVAPRTVPFPLGEQIAECNFPIATPPIEDNCHPESKTISTSDPTVYPLPGTYQVTWNLNDHQPSYWNGAAGNARDVPQTVVVKDTLPPTIKSFDYSGPLCLWAPDHKWVVLRVGEEFKAVIEDGCDPDPRLVIASATSSQAADANGSGNTSPDVVVYPGSHVCLRSERAGGDPAGRLYTLQLLAADHSGNTSDPVVQVRVSHDQNLHDCPVLPATMFLDDGDPRCQPPPPASTSICGTPGVGAGGLIAVAFALALSRPRRRAARS